MKKTKMEKGITLIALIITIVVLLILAVVAINSIQDDGMLGHAQNAAGTYNNAVANEQSMLQEYQNYLKNYIGGTGDESTGVSVSGQTWVFKGYGQITHTKDLTENVSFTSNGSSFSSISLGEYGMNPENTGVYPAIKYSSTDVYGEFDLAGIPTWRDSDNNMVSLWQTIKFVQGATVSQEFYTWLTANATQSTADSGDDTTGGENETDNTVSGVWTLNQTLSISTDLLGYGASYPVNFSVNGQNYTSVDFGLEMGELYLCYNNTTAWLPDIAAVCFGVDSGWQFTNANIIDFGTENQTVDETFKTWLVANATQGNNGGVQVTKHTVSGVWTFNDTISFDEWWLVNNNGYSMTTFTSGGSNYGRFYGDLNYNNQLTKANRWLSALGRILDSRYDINNLHRYPLLKLCYSVH